MTDSRPLESPSESEASSPASGASSSGSSRLEGSEPYGRSKPTSGDEIGSPKGGPELPSSPTCATCGRRSSTGLICCAGGSPAKTSPTPDEDAGSMGPGLGSGGSFTVSSVTYDPRSCSWRTSQLSFGGGLVEFSGAWPRSGMMRNGTASPRPPVAPLTDVIDSSLWPTPVRSEARRGTPRTNRYAQGGASLTHDVAHGLLPTPTRTVARQSHRYMPGNRTLKGALVEVQGEEPGPLNPVWLEWLMGFPPGWTDPKLSGTPSCQPWPGTWESASCEPSGGCEL